MSFSRFIFLDCRHGQRQKKKKKKKKNTKQLIYFIFLSNIYFKVLLTIKNLQQNINLRNKKDLLILCFLLFRICFILFNICFILSYICYSMKEFEEFCVEFKKN